MRQIYSTETDEMALFSRDDKLIDAAGGAASHTLASPSPGGEALTAENIGRLEEEVLLQQGETLEIKYTLLCKVRRNSKRAQQASIRGAKDNKLFLAYQYSSYDMTIMKRDPAKHYGSTVNMDSSSLNACACGKATEQC